MPPMCKNHIEELILGADVSLLMKCTFLLSRFRKHQLFTDCNLCRSVQGAPIVGPQAGLKNKWVKPLNSAGLGVSKCSSRGCTNLCEVNHSAKRRLAHPMFFFWSLCGENFNAVDRKKSIPWKSWTNCAAKGLLIISGMLTWLPRKRQRIFLNIGWSYLRMIFLSPSGDQSRNLNCFTEDCYLLTTLVSISYYWDCMGPS